MLPSVLTQKMAGLPRWAWLSIISAGIILGMYLRHRANAAAAMAGDQGDGTDVGDQYSGYADQTDPSLAGLYAPVSGGGGPAIPVENPVIPQGYSDFSIAALQALADARTAASADQAATTQAGYDAIARIVGTITPAVPTPVAPSTPATPTGGGPPSNGGARSAVDTRPSPIPEGTPATKGATIRGKEFRGATGYTAGGVGTNNGKHYREYRVYYKGGKSELWHYYSDGNKWVQR